MTDQERAREIRDKKLCGTSVCAFDAGCGCLEAIVSALSAVREETQKSMGDAFGPGATRAEDGAPGAAGASPPSVTPPIACSFCAAPQDVVAVLVHSNGIYICDECVYVAAEQCWAALRRRARRVAQGIEARRAETREAGLGAKHESAVAKGDAPITSDEGDRHDT